MDINAFIKDTAKTKEIDFRGHTLTLKELSYGTVAEFSKLASSMEDVDAMETNRVAMGNLMRAGIIEFADIKEEQVEQMSPVILKSLSEEILAFNGLQPEVVEEGKG